MRARARHLVLAATLAGLGVGVPSAHAAPGPANDTLASATVISELPFDDVVDTSRGRSDTDDSDLNEQCGAPVTNGSVWYSFTAPEGLDGLAVDVSQSDFSAGAIIAHREGSSWFVDACGPGGTGAFVTPGTTYSILAFSDTPGVTGGTLRFHAEAAVIPTVDLTVNPKGKVDRQGTAYVSGSVRCTGGDFIYLDTSLRQLVGRVAITGYGFVYDELPCDGVTRTWTSVVVPDNGKFAGGKAASFSFAFTCGSVFCADGFVEQKVMLSKGA